MGQQQLILLVLATVIVGIAIIIGIRAFTENSIKANSDAMVQDIVRVASDAQAWKQKPAPFGGQIDGPAKAVTADFTGATFTALGYTEVAGVYTNLNGTFQLAAGVTGVQICGFNSLRGNTVVVNVVGITDADIVQPAGAIVLGTATTAVACAAP